VRPAETYAATAAAQKNASLAVTGINHVLAANNALVHAQLTALHYLREAVVVATALAPLKAPIFGCVAEEKGRVAYDGRKCPEAVPLIRQVLPPALTLAAPH
jgi:hypothetical protein